MSPDKCILDPERDCLGIQKAKDTVEEVKTLGRRLDEFRQAVSETNGRFGSRIGKLEAREEVRDEQYKNIQEKLKDIVDNMSASQKGQKESLAELRKEHKESMEELKKGNKDILETVTPLKHKVEDIEKLERDVEELKSKPGETWDHIKKQGLGWFVAIILALIAAALGLSQYT